MQLLLILAFVVLPTAAVANPNCWSIQDADERARCRGAVTGRPSECTFIADRDEREQCRARASGSSDRCGSLSTEWQREKCRDAARAREAK